MKRWIAFNFVGALGIAVQMGILWMLTSGFGMNYLAATALAVEAAVLHNFLWHQHWTWADRVPGNTRIRSLALFHFTNGALSLAGNAFLMMIFVERFHIKYLHANALAIASCSIFTFFAADRIVFPETCPRIRKGPLLIPGQAPGWEESNEYRNSKQA